MGGLPEGGAMVAVQAAEDEVRPLLTGGVDIAAVNGRPWSCRVMRTRSWNSRRGGRTSGCG